MSFYKFGISVSVLTGKVQFKQEDTLKKRSFPTLQDVADAVGVSTATVSRCLNEPDKVVENTRIRVLEAVDKLNYTPNFGARAIAANRTGIYGAVIPTMENAIFARGIEAFQKTLVTKNATMLVASSEYDPERESKQIRTLVARGADGLLLIGFRRDPEIYKFLNEREIPVVSAWACSSDKSLSYVGFDNRAASAALVTKALSIGHRTFAYISAPAKSNDRASERVSGAQMAINAAGFDATSMQIIETDYSINNGREACRSILSTGEVPTLIICGNDVLAVGAIQAAKEAGMDVPGDVSIIGFDDIELASVISPALTTVHVPHAEMGRQSADSLYALVQDPSKPIQIELETRVVERESLAAPRS